MLMEASILKIVLLLCQSSLRLLFLPNTAEWCFPNDRNTRRGYVGAFKRGGPINTIDMGKPWKDMCNFK